MLDELPWVRYGDAVGWLLSDVFDMKMRRGDYTRHPSGAPSSLTELDERAPLIARAICKQLQQAAQGVTNTSPPHISK
ncbi:hypothetical protein [Chondromyces apiculatus]|uniref:Uncharacterized protein n=1 Tax=Chondromyces apiculatus DSM 436 TaxID=1192034 RepID=A0A017SZG8_9BACT|nr:hypothetical protein [Chondromyces apiculatus]EYF02368.1 Hypothetical protein CAP_7139 [Chondromyces apiculatus DSM 436]